MAVPKRKTSKSRIRTRRHVKKAVIPASQPCPKCGAAKQPHRVCQSCGYYNGRQVITVEAE